jgi:hypothetical protein
VLLKLESTVFCVVLIFNLLHFLFYINDLPEIININSKPVLFAGDTSLIITNGSPIEFKRYRQ